MLNSQTQKVPCKKIHKIGQGSFYVGVAPSLVKALNIDEISTFVTQEPTPEGDGIIMRIRRLTA